jgi:L-amino acid N-acyltransferase YncA
MLLIYQSSFAARVLQGEEEKYHPVSHFDDDGHFLGAAIFETYEEAKAYLKKYEHKMFEYTFKKELEYDKPV